MLVEMTDETFNSNELEDSMDQENAPHHDLAIPKKRTKTKTATTAPTAPSAATAVTTTATNHPPSHHLAATQILSPKSSNARTIPGSPFRATMASPFKSKLAGPYTSPAKPAVNATTTRTTGRTLNGMVEKAKTGRAKAARKVTPATRAKATTTATVTAPVPATATATKGKRSAQVSVTVTETVVKKKTTIPKKAEPPPVAERRVLRKRA
jgi:hypothetical protein